MLSPIFVFSRVLAMRKIAIVIAILFSVLSNLAQAQNRFVENGGQWPDRVLFAKDLPGGKLYLEGTTLTFDLYDQETVNSVNAAHGGGMDIPIPKKLPCHAYTISLANARENYSVQAGTEVTGSYNYFKGNDPSKWGSNLKGYDGITFQKVYDHIDLKIYQKGNTKYDFIVHPGGNVAEIELVYDGVKPKTNEKGQLVIETSVGTITESKPFAYQVRNGRIEVVECAYQLNGRKLHFDLGSYDPSIDLIIDPELIFSTYSGSGTDNFGFTATFDLDGHLYSGSSAFGTEYPTTSGAYQTDWAGGSSNGAGTDIAITKFALNGTSLVYSTYLGGGRDDLPHSIIVDDLGNLYVFGTTSSDDFPLGANPAQDQFNGGTPFTPQGIGVNYTEGSDMIVSRLSPSGTALEGSTYLGGTGNDGINSNSQLKYNYADEMRGEIELEPSGNVVIGSTTLSDDFPIVGSPYQSVKGSGQDGVIVELTPDLSSIVTSTYFGGNGDDAIYSIHCTSDSRITVAGGTRSSDLPTDGGSYQEDFEGGRADGFVARFENNASDLFRVTYLGSSSYDQIYFVDVDGEGNPHIFGQTEAPDSTFIINADFSNSNSGMLVTSFTPGLTNVNWSTVFGDNENAPNLSPTAFSVDICNHVYLSGWGGGPNNNPNYGGPMTTTNGLTVTDDAIKSTTDGNDFYFMVMESDASALTFATYFGGNTSQEHVDGGTSRFDRTGKIYQAVCAGCGSNDDFPIEPPNAWSPTNGSPNCNLGVAKIDFILPLVFADYESTPACLPDPVEFNNTSTVNTEGNPNYQWIFPNDDIVMEENPSYFFDTPGVYDVTLIITDPLACNISDTITHQVEVFPEIVLSIDDVQSCTESTFDLEISNNGAGTYFEWAEDINFNSIIEEGPTDSLITYTGDEQIMIYIRVSNENCDKIDSVLVSPAPSLTLDTEDVLLCSIQEYPVQALVTGGYDLTTVIWQPDNKIIEGQNTTNVLLDADEPISLSVDITTEFGCDLSASAQVDVYPIELEVTEDTLACVNNPIDLVANSNGWAESFVWSDTPDFSNILNPSGDSTITIIPTSIVHYFARVENNGCVLIDTVAVSLLSAGTTVSADQYICLNDTALIFVSNDFPGSQLAHTWSPDEYIISGQNTSFIRVFVEEPTTFTVVSETEFGCSVENSSTVYLSPLGGQEVDAHADPIHLLEGDISQLSGTPDYSDYLYHWDPPTYLTTPVGRNTTSQPDETITYTLTIIDQDPLGVCVRTDSVTLFVYEAFCGEPNIFVPNTFTPNGDGENDQLWVRGYGVITSMEFVIYNRWGEEVFATNDLNQGWDGTYKGDLAEPAVYVYYLRARCAEGEEYFKKGNVTLLR